MKIYQAYLRTISSTLDNQFQTDEAVLGLTEKILGYKEQLLDPPVAKGKIAFNNPKGLVEASKAIHKCLLDKKIRPDTGEYIFKCIQRIEESLDSRRAPPEEAVKMLFVVCEDIQKSSIVPNFFLIGQTNHLKNILKTKQKLKNYLMPSFTHKVVYNTR